MVTKIITRIFGANAAAKKTRRVLVVDNDEVTGKLIGEYLKPMECGITYAASADEALKVLNKDQGFRLVVADVMKSGKNGLLLIRRMRKTPNISKTPVLVITDGMRPSDVEKFKSEHKRTEVMMKPLKMKPFCDEVERAFKTGYA